MEDVKDSHECVCVSGGLTVLTSVIIGRRFGKSNISPHTVLLCVSGSAAKTLTLPSTFGLGTCVSTK